MEQTYTAQVARLTGVRVWTAEGAHLLRDVNWTIERGEDWALLGPNGAGKSTLLAVVSGIRFPSSGTVDLFGGRLGEIDVRAARRRIGIVNPGLRLHDWMSVREVILTGVTGALRLLPGSYDADDERRAVDLEALFGLTALSDHAVGTCSQGERQRVRLARALMPQPEALLLDEPASGLDLPAREALLASLSALRATQPDLTTVFVSHHLEELPTTTSHALLINKGAVVASGIVGQALTSAAISECFGVPIEIERSNGRWYARAQAAWVPGSPENPKLDT